MPRDTAPTWWPARPTRWSPLATDGGEPTWTTRSMAPMSMPSSSELVATTAGSRPALSSDSVRVRSARLIEPWCARARMVAASRVSMPTAVPDCAGTCAARSVAGSGTSSPDRSAHTSFIRAVSRSAPRRELVNTSVERCAATRSTTRSSTCGQMDGRGSSPAAAPDRSSSSSAGRGAAQVGQVRHGDDDVDHDLLGRRRLHDDDGAPPVLERARAAQELGDRVDRADRGRQADPLRRAGTGRVVEQGVEPLERQREVRAALGAGDRVDLVDDDRAHAREPGPGARRQHEVQRLGRR